MKTIPFNTLLLTCLFIITLTSCSGDSEAFDPGNVQLSRVMPGSWRLTSIKEFENGKEITVDDGLIACLSQASHVYRQDLSFELINAHYWLFGGIDNGYCGEANGETGTWSIVDNKTVIRETVTAEGNTYTRRFDPEFLDRNTFRIVSETASAEVTKVKEVYYTRSN